VDVRSSDALSGSSRLGRPRTDADQLTAAAGALDLLAGRTGEGVRMHGERLRELTLAEHLDRHIPAAGQAVLAQ